MQRNKSKENVQGFSWTIFITISIKVLHQKQHQQHKLCMSPFLNYWLQLFCLGFSGRTILTTNSHILFYYYYYYY